ncbi:helix-turn-helix domain-containing protein [Gordonia sp. (in: high G+C Gram-positive bacteria)]|uniref:helix-turn-helix domain-containing protein n=1 Tax=Gordonia sp. (in: high G+C Gram-positive bacteria) TaxID=84139 RepID=UPI0039E60518
MVDPSRGVLYPTRLPSFTRIGPPARVADLVGWFWIPEWDLPPGRSSRQHLVAYPSCNLVVEADGVGLAGPSTRISHRDLTGRGWAVGALLRPAAVATLTEDPGSLRDAYAPVRAPDLHTAVCAAMSGSDQADRHRAAVEAYSDWLVERVGLATAEARLANEMAGLLMTDSSVLRLDDAAQALAVSSRTLQRLARRYVGVSPTAIIRRRRLQEAAQVIRDDPHPDLSAIAADLGYADHAHLTNDFAAVLAFTPSAYRATIRSDENSFR